MSKRFLIFCPSAVFVSLSLILLLRSFFSASPSKATVNLESASAVALILCWCLIAGNRQSVEHGRSGVIFTVLPLLVVPPFLITLGSPFLYDGYAQVVNASKQSFQDVVRTFYIHPTGGDFFFRPLGALDFWLESKWAGLSPVRWQLDGLLLHLSAVYLLFILCRLLDLSGQASCFASLFFGLHGTSPEVVSWTAARFDELAACFVLVTLICFCKLLDKSNWYPLMILSCLCAVLSKEAAFCVPALAICCLWYRGRLGSEGGSARTPWAAILGLAGTCGMVFVYRFWLLGGIGGYRDASGSPTILSGTGGSFRVLELLFFRMWSVLLFPINWSAGAQIWLVVALLMLVFCIAWSVFASKPHLNKVLASIAFAMFALLPAFHLALLDARITGSRVYHLAIIGLALLIAAVCDGFNSRLTATAVFTSLFLFQSAALVHNQLVWRDVAQLAKNTCSAFASVVSPTDGPTVVLNLPSTHNGVYFLSNGFSACVYINSGKRLLLFNSPIGHAGLPSFIWSEKSETIQRQ